MHKRGKCLIVNPFSYSKCTCSVSYMLMVGMGFKSVTIQFGFHHFNFEDAYNVFIECYLTRLRQSYLRIQCVVIFAEMEPHVYNMCYVNTNTHDYCHETHQGYNISSCSSPEIARKIGKFQNLQ